MGSIFKAPKPPKIPDPVIDVEETADVAVPIDSDGGANTRKRMAASRSRVGRGQLQIPRLGSDTLGGIFIPK